MKGVMLFLMLYILPWGIVCAQTMKLVDPKETALLLLKSNLKEVSGVTNEQFDQLADVELKIDKEYPFLTTVIYSTKKKRVELMEVILSLREKLYPAVLTPKQMEQYHVVLQKSREILRNN